MVYDEILRPFASEDVPSTDDEDVESTETPVEEETGVKEGGDAPEEEEV